MKYFSLVLPRRQYEWHEEDSFLASKTLPILAVADGVTLSDYTGLIAPFGPKIIADIFCQESVKYVEKHFEELSGQTLLSSYLAANQEVRKYNDSQGKIYSTVAALVAIKNRKVFGSRLTDCGFALIRKGELVFKTPEFWTWLKKSDRQGYGIINGQIDPTPYVDVYELEAEPGDLLLVFSDGFENHFSVPEFVGLFEGSDLEILETKIREIDRELAGSDEEKYGHERTLVVAALS